MVCLGIFILINAASGTVALAEGDKITIKGSTTVLPIAQIMAEEFMDENHDITISVQGGGSGVGIASLIDGTADIADSSRKMSRNELERAKASGVSPYEITIALDGIAVVVHPSNIKNYLNTDQLRAIYTGKISNWSEIGGEHRKIVVISRDTSSGTYEAFADLALSGQKVRPDALITASNQAVNLTVAQTPGAIGYLGLGYVSKKVKAVRINTIECTKDTIRSGKYPLSRPLYMYTNGIPEGTIKTFIDYVQSRQGQELVESQGFVSIRIHTIKNPDPDDT
ncbi:MAG TPA: phosphate ABC transporter substrate-binding protein [Deltaproteobacteria bacterium]|nr:phosphate ABC transporter substrate-binding protein [Deltaproteobacteria bacterium]